MHIPEDAEDDNLVLYSFGSLAPSAAPYRYVYRHNRLQSERMRVGSERIIIRTIRLRKYLVPRSIPREQPSDGPPRDIELREMTSCRRRERGIYSQCSFTSVNKIKRPGVCGAWAPNAGGVFRDGCHANLQRCGRAAVEGRKSPGAAGLLKCLQLYLSRCVFCQTK